jgi:hypothetical protein
MKGLVIWTVMDGRNCTTSSRRGIAVYRPPMLRTREHREQGIPSHPNGIYDHGTVSPMP